MSSLKLPSSELALPLGSLVLVTGASGFIASHIVEQLLLAGYTVRGTVRTEKQVTWTTELFKTRHGAGKFSAVIVPEMSISGAFDEAVKGVQGIIHTASIVNFSPDPNAVIPQTIAGQTSLLTSASQTPTVKSFVYTSSSVAVSGGTANAHLTLTENSWNEAQIKEAWSVTAAPFPPKHAYAVYGASKAEAEKALWKFVEEEKPAFKVNTILPDGTFGEVLSLEGSLSTGAWMRAIFENKAEFVRSLPPAWYVDVDDAARLHVAALVSKSISNERIFSYAKAFTWNEVLAIMRNDYPGREFPADVPGEAKSNLTVPNERGDGILREVFGRDGWNSLEEVIRKNLKGLGVEA